MELSNLSKKSLEKSVFLKKLSLFLFVMIISMGFISASEIYINSCQTLNQSDTIYYLTGDLQGEDVTAKCMNIISEKVTLDCQGHEIINKDLRNILIFSNKHYTTIRNCILSSNKNSYSSNAIVLRGNEGLIENNKITESYWGIDVSGYSNLIKNNYIDASLKGIQVSNDNNIVKNNLVKDNLIGGMPVRGYGITIWRGKNNQFINNKVYGKLLGALLYNAVDTTLKCDKYYVNKWDIRSYLNSNGKLIGVTYNTSYEADNFIEIEDDCDDVDCIWFGDECFDDKDRDNVPDKDDLCLNTSKDETVIIYGCSCSQILELKPGKNKGELKNGCSKGTIEVFTKQIGWAKDLFE